jgi:hypothetical protein
LHAIENSQKLSKIPFRDLDTGESLPTKGFDITIIGKEEGYKAKIHKLIILIQILVLDLYLKQWKHKLNLNFLNL